MCWTSSPARVSAIRVRRRYSSTAVIKVLTDLFLLCGIPDYTRSDNELDLAAEADRQWIWGGRGPHGVHRAGLALEEWLHRELQSAVAGQTLHWRDLLHTGRGPSLHRTWAASLQCRPAPGQLGIPPIRPGSDHPIKLASFDLVRVNEGSHALGRGLRPVAIKLYCVGKE